MSDFRDDELYKQQTAFNRTMYDLDDPRRYSQKRPKPSGYGSMDEVTKTRKLQEQKIREFQEYQKRQRIEAQQKFRDEYGDEMGQENFETRKERAAQNSVDPRQQRFHQTQRLKRNRMSQTVQALKTPKEQSPEVQKVKETPARQNITTVKKEQSPEVQEVKKPSAPQNIQTVKKPQNTEVPTVKIASVRPLAAEKPKEEPDFENDPRFRDDERRKKSKRKQKKGKTFKKSFLIYLAIFTSVMLVCLGVLWAFLAEYEKSRPERIVEETIRNIQNSDTTDIAWATSDGTFIDTSSDFFSNEAITGFIGNAVSGKELTYRKLNSETTDDTCVYLVKAGNEQLFKMVLRLSSKKKAFNLANWKLDQVRVLSGEFESNKVTAQIPNGKTLELNGKPVDFSNIVTSGDNISILQNLIDKGFLNNVPTVDTYSVSGLFTDPVLTTTNTNGSTSTCVLENDIFFGGFDASQEFIDSQKPRVLDIIEPYGRYFSLDGDFSELEQYLISESPAYVNTLSAGIYDMQDHDGTEITGKDASNFRVYGDNCFSCEVTFSQAIYQYGEIAKNWNSNLIWIFVKSGDTYYLADMVTKNAE